MKLSNYPSGMSSSYLRERVQAARKIQIERFKSIEKVNCNAHMTSAMIKEFCILEEEGNKLLKLAYDRFQYSARSFHKFLKVARTFADLENSEIIRKKDIARALMARDIDKEQSAMLMV